MDLNPQSLDNFLENSKLPINLEEFLKQQNLEEWPQRLSSEGALLADSNSLLGTKEDIKDALKAAAPLRLEVLDELEQRLDTLERQLYEYSSLTLTDHQRPSKIRDNIFHIPKKVEEMVEHGDGIQVFRHELRRKEKRKVFDGSADKGSKSVESIHFPGFYSQEMLELPGQYEAPILMNAITQRQHFNTGFMKFWKRIYLSEASVAIMQDMFWWIFLDKFEGKSVSSRPASDEEEPLKRMGEMDTKEAKDKLFNRISDSFVNLFFSINPDMKDKFLNVYPNCLAQTIFACYTECFPISKILFDHSFKQFVAHICYEWISGVKPNPNVLSSWKTEKLMSTVAPEQTTSESKTTSKGIDVNQCFDAFKKRTESSKLSGEGDAANAGVNMSRQLLNTARMDKTSMAAVGSDEMERLPFSIYGRSPLVAHWLRSKHLAGKSQHKTGPQSMVRMQIDHINEETLTFADIIREVKENAVRRRKEVYRIENETQKEIRRIDENLKLQLRNLNKFQDKMSREM